MSHPIPPGTRDVLPDEMRELRAISARMRSTFEEAGYGEVHTPALLAAPPARATGPSTGRATCSRCART
jgi:ATP phosphoribosyltransferase regulatory subunit HisZ